MSFKGMRKSIGNDGGADPQRRRPLIFSHECPAGYSLTSCSPALPRFRFTSRSRASLDTGATEGTVNKEGNKATKQHKQRLHVKSVSFLSKGYRSTSSDRGELYDGRGYAALNLRLPSSSLASCTRFRQESFLKIERM